MRVWEIFHGFALVQMLWAVLHFHWYKYYLVGSMPVGLILTNTVKTSWEKKPSVQLFKKDALKFWQSGRNSVTFRCCTCSNHFLQLRFSTKEICWNSCIVYKFQTHLILLTASVVVNPIVGNLYYSICN